MITIIAGSRDFNDADHLRECLSEVEVYGWYISVVVSGEAAGADYLGKLWSYTHDRGLEKYPAEWDKYGKSAGYRRNVEMASSAECLVAFWDGKSKGTKHMIDTAIKKGLYTKVFYV